jgi:hypothetical protein
MNNELEKKLGLGGCVMLILIGIGIATMLLRHDPNTPLVHVFHACPYPH